MGTFSKDESSAQAGFGNQYLQKDLFLDEFCHFDSSGEQNIGNACWKLILEHDADAMRVNSPLSVLLFALRQIPDIEPHFGRVEIVLTELYANALEHGVLALDSREKDSPDGFDRYYQERNEKLSALQEGWIRIELRYYAGANGKGGKLSILLEDSGEGFDYNKYYVQQTDDQENSIRPYGRGFNLVNSLCNSLQYRGRGNIVEAHCCWETIH